MKRSINILLVAVVSLVMSLNVAGQSRQELEKQRLNIIKDIEKSSKQLESTKKDKEKNLGQLKVLEEQMSSRKKLISNLETEVTINEKTIEENKKLINDLKTKHQALRDQYSVMLRANYLRKQTNSKWTYLLSSENLNSLILRWRYLSQFDNFTKAKLAEIVALTGEITQKNEEIEKVKLENLTVLEETSKNVETLAKEQKEKDKIIKKLSKEELSLQSTIKKREKERESLNIAIENVILAELAKAKDKEKGDVAVSKKKEIDDSSFTKNKGNLNWPVTNGKITGKFGTHPHPTLKNVQISNNGVDFTLPSVGSVSCVFDGEVVGKTTIPGFNNMIIIKHGSYYTVYSKLEATSVTKGQKVKRGQKIGEVALTEDGKAELHFELWKDKSKLDPEKWFSK